MSRVIAIVNQKGGVGKTTTAINLGASFAVAERKTLVVDMDPQGNATSGLGVRRSNIDRSMYEVLVDGEPIQSAIIPSLHFKNLDLVPSDVDLVGAEVQLVERPERETLLRRALRDVREHYDFVLVDCPPSLGLLTLNTLAAADAWNRAARALDKGWEAFARYADRVTLDQIVFALMYADIGSDYTGFGGLPGYIMTVYGTPDEYTRRRVEAATVHELHHNLMSSIGKQGGAAFDWSDFMNSTTVADYMIGEGLAEAFAAELYGEDVTGPWVAKFDEAKLDEVKGIFRDGLHLTGFNTIRAYIFGDQIADEMNLPKVGLPPYAGYALGYRIVKAYTQRTSKSVVDTSFVPAAEIIAESHFLS